MLSNHTEQAVYLSRLDVNHPLSSFSRHAFELDGAQWPSVEHYYQGMKFADPDLREAIRTAAHPLDAQKLAKKNKRKVRGDWPAQKVTIMTRAVYVKSRTHADAAAALLSTGDAQIIETSQYDYFWGCGRDQRGNNNYGRVLMSVRAKLRELQAQEDSP